MSSRISQPRKASFYLGSVLMAVGLLLFLSTFVTFAMNFGEFDGFKDKAQSSMIRAVGGMVLLVFGGFLRRAGARGLAGSGVVLDPQRARDELEPYSRMAGGMAKDALDEARIDLGGAGRRDREAGPVVMLKCTYCRKLNEEDSKFCQECGRGL